MNIYNLILSSLQLTPGNYSDYRKFSKKIKDRYTNSIETISEFENRIDDRLDTFKNSNILKSEIISDYLESVDLKRALKNIEVFEKTDYISKINLIYEEISKILIHHGIVIEKPEIKVVPQFPIPYDNMNWLGFSSGGYDKDNYGIENAIYILEEEIAFYFSELLFAHELIHFIVGRKSPYAFGRGLEDGLAEFVGKIYFGYKLFESEITTNVFINSRYYSNATQSKILYLEYTRQAAIIYKYYGLKGIFELIEKGRDEIKNVEMKLYNGKIDDLNLNKGNWDDDFTKLVDNLLLNFISNLYVTPTSYYLTQFITSGITIKELSEKSKIPINDVNESLIELKNRVYITIASGRIT